MVRSAFGMTTRASGLQTWQYVVLISMKSDQIINQFRLSFDIDLFKWSPDKATSFKWRELVEKTPLNEHFVKDRIFFFKY